MRKPSRLKAAVIYRGPSLIDGAPIVVIATYTGANRKTGLVLQTYILRADMSPLKASKTGADYSICGNCKMRGKPTKRRDRKQAIDRPCYVVLGQGPLIVFKAFRRGVYPTIEGHTAIADLGADRVVRLGTYGDPAAVPSYVWESLLSRCERHMAYSHQSNMQGAAFDGRFMMVSADNLDDAKAAWLRGDRTFRVTRPGEANEPNEITCPSLRGVHCNACGLCGGAQVKAKSITIPAHGAGASAFI
jgi:hypothetical protein